MIRDVHPADIPAILAIYNEQVLNADSTFELKALSCQEMESRIRGVIAHRLPYFVWEEDGQVLGFCYAHPWKERAAYAPTLEATLYLAPEIQRKGIGQTMLAELIRRCRDLGYVSMIACITANNAGSIRLCEKMGFAKVSHFKQVGRKHGRLLDVVDYQLMLNDNQELNPAS